MTWLIIILLWIYLFSLSTNSLPLGTHWPCSPSLVQLNWIVLNSWHEAGKVKQLHKTKPWDQHPYFIVWPGRHVQTCLHPQLINIFIAKADNYTLKSFGSLTCLGHSKKKGTKPVPLGHHFGKWCLFQQKGHQNKFLALKRLINRHYRMDFAHNWWLNN